MGKRLRARVHELETQNAALHKDMSSAVHEREEWKSGALRMQLNREFKDTITSLENERRCFLKPTCSSAIPDFGEALQQQMRLHELPRDGGHHASDRADRQDHM